MDEGVARRLIFDSTHEVIPELNSDDFKSAHLELTLAVIEELEAIADDGAFAADCERLERLHGDHRLIWSARVRRLINQKRLDEAQALVRGRKLDEYDDAGRIAQAEFLYDAHAQEEAGRLFTQLIHQYPERRDIRMNYAKRLFADGSLLLADAVMAPVRNTFTEGTRSRALCEKAEALLALLTRLEGAPIAAY